MLAIVSLAEPRVFQFVVRHLVSFEAWRSGGQACVGRVEGSLFEPVVLVDTVWTLRTQGGAVMRIESHRIAAELAWANLFKRTSNRWFQRLSLNGVTAKIELPSQPAKPRKDRPWRALALDWTRSRWMPSPSIVEGRGADLLFASGEDFIRLEGTRFRFSEFEPGIVKTANLVVNQPWLQRTFPSVRGTTALQDSTVLLGRVRIEPGVEIKSISANLGELAHGRFHQNFNIDAFGGNISGEAEMKTDSRPFRFEAGGNFSQIDIGRLAGFLGRSESAGGTIRNGHFSFRGSPENVEKSTTRLFLDATDFQWESRQWDSLVGGVTLIDRRLEVHDCALQQGDNSLTLDGALTLPSGEQQWWQGDFNCEFAAKIDNLTELSALLLPESTFAAGRGSIEGSVRGHAEKFQGHLVVDASKLVWRDAPIEELHATLKIAGNELQVAHFNAFNGGDYVRGSGVVNILGPTQYWGTLHGSVGELGKYAAILQKPILPEPLAGGANIDWDGEGSAKGHTGKFTARLQKLRSLGSSAALLHPINADLDGSYAAGGMVFSKFALSDDESSFTANVTVSEKRLDLRGIRLMHKQQLRLEGDALLPLDVWRAWPSTSLETLLNDDVESKVALTAYDLELGTAAKLSGWNFPIEGVVRGDFTAEGPLAALKIGGKLSLSKARIPLGSSGKALTGVESTAAFDGGTVTLAQFTGQHPTGDFRAHGTVDLKNVRDPGLHLAVESERTSVAVFDDSATADVGLNVTIEGPASSAEVAGSANVLAVQPRSVIEQPILGSVIFGGDPNEPLTTSVAAFDTAGIWTGEPGSEFPPIFEWNSAPWNAWRFNIAIHGGPLAEPSSLAACEAHFAGTGAAPELEGGIAFRDTVLTAGDTVLSNAGGSLTWHEGEVSIDSRASGELHGLPFTAHLIGPVRQPIRFFDFAPPLSEKIISDALAGRYRDCPRLEDAPRFALRFPSAFTPDVPLFDWTVADPDAVSENPPPPQQARQ